MEAKTDLNMFTDVKIVSSQKSNLLVYLEKNICLSENTFSTP